MYRMLPACDNLVFFSSFRFRPLGLPVLHKVRVHNVNGQSSIQMLSISGNTIHFHCSFFADKVSTIDRSWEDVRVRRQYATFYVSMQHAERERPVLIFVARRSPRPLVERSLLTSAIVRSTY